MPFSSKICFGKRPACRPRLEPLEDRSPASSLFGLPSDSSDAVAASPPDFAPSETPASLGETPVNASWRMSDSGLARLPPTVREGAQPPAAGTALAALTSSAGDLFPGRAAGIVQNSAANSDASDIRFRLATTPGIAPARPGEYANPNGGWSRDNGLTGSTPPRAGLDAAANSIPQGRDIHPGSLPDDTGSCTCDAEAGHRSQPRQGPIPVHRLSHSHYVSPGPNGDGRPATRDNGDSPLTITHLEVTQAIQTLDNTVPLVAYKPTFVRVYVGVDSPQAVDGTLQVYRDGAEIPGSPFSSLNGPIVAQVTPNREREDDTLNFRLPPLARGSYHLVASIPGSTYPMDVNFVCRPPQTIWYVRVDYRPNFEKQENLPDPNLTENAGAFIRAAYPFSSDLVYRRAPSETPYLLTRNINAPGVAQDVLNDIAMMRILMDPRPHYLFAWLPGTVYNLHGIEDPSRHVALANADPDGYRSTLAHELGHDFGMPHNSRQLGEVGIDVDNQVGLGRIRPHNLADIMVPGLSDSQRWVDTTSYRVVFDGLASRCDPDLGVPAPPGGRSGSEGYPGWWVPRERSAV